MAAPVDVKEKTAPVIDWSVWARTPGLEKFGPGSKVELIDGGVINFVYRVRSDKDDKLTVVVKNSEPYVKAFTMQPLSPERARVEIWAMRKMDTIVPGSVPTPYLHQPDQNFMVLEDLGGYQLLREQLNLGRFDISLVWELVRRIAKLHRVTHRVTIDEASHREMIQFCTLNDMQFIRTTVLFDDPIDQKGEGGQYAREVEAFTGDQTLYPNWLKLRSVAEKNHDCLAHGDFHTSSVMIMGSSIKIFDFEMAHMGPAGTDLGHMLCNFVKPYFDHKCYPVKDAPAYHEQLKTALYDIVDAYFQEAREYLSDADFARTISETAGFTGARLIRRVWGFHEPDEGLNEPLTDQGCLRVGQRLIRDYEKIQTTQDLKRYLVEQDE
ncbi:methylthioribose kinase-like isoform X2 [Patiria miniata]|nr:methylthioribose kinase-like isoform X2 [Patiria miniata]